VAIDKSLKGHLLPDLLEDTQGQTPVWSPEGKVDAQATNFYIPYYIYYAPKPNLAWIGV
jgi:hypothetical protein